MEVAFVLVLLAATIVVVRVVVTFDFGAWIKDRRKRAETRLKLLCPHAILRPREEGQFEVRMTLHSPAGTLMWICSRCQFRTTNEDVARQLLDQYTKHPDLLIKKERQFDKAAKKVFKI